MAMKLNIEIKDEIVRENDYGFIKVDALTVVRDEGIKVRDQINASIFVNPMDSREIIDNREYYYTAGLNNETFAALMRKRPNTRHLNCSNFNITDLGNYLPFLLKTLECAKCPLTRIDNLLSGSLTVLNCVGCAITYLSPLPPNLVELRCDDNPCTVLGLLPERMKILSCKNNKLRKIPYLPQSLDYLDCSGNQLTELGIIHAGINYINCVNNKLEPGELYSKQYSTKEINKWATDETDKLKEFIHKHAIVYSLRKLNINSALCFIGIPIDVIKIVLSFVTDGYKLNADTVKNNKNEDLFEHHIESKEIIVGNNEDYYGNNFICFLRSW